MIGVLLSKIKLIHILIIALILLIGYASWATGEIRYQKSESHRKGDNFKSLQDMDSMKVAHLTFRTNEEIKDYVASIEGLSNLIEEKNLKIRRLENIVYQKQQYIDQSNRTTDVSGILESIKNSTNIELPWRDSTECLIIDGNVKYCNGSLSVNVNNREFNNEIAITGSLERSKYKFLWWRWSLLGRKRAVVTATSKCGNTETIIIERKD